MTDQNVGAPERILAALLEARAGHALTLDRSWLFDAALQPLLRAHGLPSLEALVVALASTDDPALLASVIDALINHETYFFRDTSVFEALDAHALEHLRRRAGERRRLDIWSVGCSTGQEPYSLAILMADRRNRWVDWQVRLLATDISASVINVARTGRYSHFEIQRGLPARAMIDWFEPDGTDWLLRGAIRQKVDFAVHNLLADPLPPGPFDFILCRNLLYYLTPDHRARAIDKLADALAPGGLLMLGAFETMLDSTGRFAASPDARGMYQRVDAMPRRLSALA